MTVRVENDGPRGSAPHITATGHGQPGLRERVQRLGGSLDTGPATDGGWILEARLPSD